MSKIYQYKIVIKFSDENPVLAGRPDMPVLSSKHTSLTDTYSFRMKNAIRIEARRKYSLLDKASEIYGNGNSIHIQIMKAISLYCLTSGKCVKIKSIVMSRKSPKARTYYYYKETKNFKQPFPERNHAIVALPLDVVKGKMGHEEKDYAYRIAMSYFLREQYSLHPYHKFECLWRAYNCLFRHLTGKKNDNAGIRGMIDHVLLHQNKYVQTLACASRVNLNDKMFKFKSFLEDKTEHLKSRNNIKQWFGNFTKSNILDVIRNNESKIDAKVDVVNTTDATIIKSDLHTYLTTTSEDTTKVDAEMFIFMLWYAYYLRNMYFHAGIKEASFTLYSEYNDKHLMCVKEIMETFLQDIFKDDTF